MKINRIDIAAATLVGVLSIYLFVEAPTPMINEEKTKGEKIHVHALFKIVAEENNKARKQWTKHIVVNGIKVGLKFGEDWRESNVDKGPLPALFLRETASHLEKSPVPLSLFLGSDFPISTSNKFKGQQAVFFEAMRVSGKNQFFYDSDVNRYTAMFPDSVVVQVCADCNNEHKDTPKKDWKMHDIMGATTWAYPHEYVTRDDLVIVIKELRKAFKKSYLSYIEKTKSFVKQPLVGSKWPEDGYYLPQAKVFMSRLENSSAVDTLSMLMLEENSK